MRVKTNCFYKYNPCAWDKFRPCTGNTLEQGDVVRVINLHGAPPANTMGQCYVGDLNGKFICMVSTASLESLTADEKKILRMARTPAKYRIPSTHFRFEPAV